MKTPTLLVVCLTVIPFLLSSQKIDKKLGAAINLILSDCCDGDRPGAAIGIVKNGELVYSRGYGAANLENGISFTPETVSDIGSVAKQMTDFAIVLLAQQGKLSIDDDIRKYLPEVPDFGAPITIRHLIHHTSGLREIYGVWAIAGGRSGDGILQADALRLATHSKELNFKPGDRHSYCNTGYMLLAEIISRVGEAPFEDWMQTHIFRPLNMDNTFIMNERGELFPRCADSYEKSENNGFRKIFDNSTVQGAGGVYSTIPDLARWMNNYRDPRTGGPAAIAQMMERGVLNNGDTLDYAFGLVIDLYRGVRRIRHTGASAGYRAIFTYFPDQDLGMVMKSNFAGFNGADLTDKITDLVLKTELAPAPPANQPAAIKPGPDHSLSLDELAAYAGVYYCPELETVYRISVQEGGLVADHRRHSGLKLKALEKDIFEDTAGPLGKIRFIRDVKGAVSGMRITSGGVMDLWMERRLLPPTSGRE